MVWIGSGVLSHCGLDSRCIASLCTVVNRQSLRLGRWMDAVCPAYAHNEFNMCYRRRTYWDWSTHERYLTSQYDVGFKGVFIILFS